MQNKTGLIAVAIVIMISVGTLVATAMPNDAAATQGDRNKDALKSALGNMRSIEADYPSRLLVLGNADLDDDLDSQDIDRIQYLIDHGYNYIQDYMADANYDGLINKADIEYLEKLIAFEEVKVYYFNVDYEIACYNKAYPLHLANILTQTLESECILCPQNIVATDERCYKGGSMGKFYTEFESVLDYSELENIGSHKNADFETYAVVAKHNGGYLTVWMNSQYTYNNGYLDERFSGTTVQIVRLPSWEKASTINGILTAGYLFNKQGENTAWSNAVAFTGWYDALDSIIKEKAKSVPESERKKVISASFSSSDDNLFINGSLAGEHLNVARIGIDDVTEKYFSDNGITGTWYTSLSKEEATAFYQKYGIDLIVGTVAAPYNATHETLVSAYDVRVPLVSSLPGVSMITTGWIIGSGPSELLFSIIVAKAAYPELYTDIDLEKYTNEFLQYLGTYGDGPGQWTYDKLEPRLYYTGGA